MRVRTNLAIQGYTRDFGTKRQIAVDMGKGSRLLLLEDRSHVKSATLTMPHACNRADVHHVGVLIQMFGSDNEDLVYTFCVGKEPVGKVLLRPAIRPCRTRHTKLCDLTPVCNSWTFRFGLKSQVSTQDLFALNCRTCYTCRGRQ